MKNLPASTPILSALAAAAIAAIQAIAPLTAGNAPNWAVIVTTFLAVFVVTFLVAAYHLRLSSPEQAALIAALTSLVAPLAQRLATPARPAAIDLPSPVAPAGDPTASVVNLTPKVATAAPALEKPPTP